MRSLKKIQILMALLLSSALSAQQVNEVEMADAMRANGKIYVVVAVLCIIFIGIVIYLINIDRKVSKLEKQSHSQPSPNGGGLKNC